MSGPIAPSDLRDDIPEDVFEAFNELIQKGQGYVDQEELISLVTQKMGPGCVFRYEWLNIENAYRKKGWRVKYHRSRTGESSHYTFKVK